MIKYNKENFTVEIQGANEQILTDLTFMIMAFARKINKPRGYVLDMLKEGLGMTELMESLSGKKVDEELKIIITE